MADFIELSKLAQYSSEQAIEKDVVETSVNDFTSRRPNTGEGSKLRWVYKSKGAVEDNDSFNSSGATQRTKNAIIEFTTEKVSKYHKQAALKAYKMSSFSKLQNQSGVIAREVREQTENLTENFISNWYNEILADISGATNGGRTFKTLVGGTATSIKLNGLLGTEITLANWLAKDPEIALQEIKNDILSVIQNVPSVNDTPGAVARVFEKPILANKVIVVCSPETMNLISQANRINARLLTRQEAQEYGISGKRVMDIGQGTLMIEENYFGTGGALFGAGSIHYLIVPKKDGAYIIDVAGGIHSGVRQDVDSSDVNIFAELNGDAMVGRVQKTLLRATGLLTITGTEDEKRSVAIAAAPIFLNKVFGKKQK